VKHLSLFLAVLFFAAAPAAAVPVEVIPVAARNGMVVAAHPQAAAIGLHVLQQGGNAIDAAVATSLALGVAEPYGSGLGGKLMLLYHEARRSRTYAVDAMDAAGTLEPSAYAARPLADRSQGYSAVCVPGLGAGLWAIHQRWGVRSWADNVRPAIELARRGALVLPKNRDLFEEQERTLRRGDPEIARLFLPDGEIPPSGSWLRNPDLANTLARFATHGRDGFYRGAVAEAIVSAVEKGGGVLTLDDLARYEARITETLAMTFRDFQIESAPPPACGTMLFLPALKALEHESFGGGPLRTAANLDLIGRVWRAAAPEMWTRVGDTSDSRGHCESLLAPASIAAIRHQASSPGSPRITTTKRAETPLYESEMAATTHFIVVDREGNIVCATQSLSLHFGAGVVPPGTGVVLNNSMSNFTFNEPENINYVAPGKRSRSTISPTIVFRGGKPVLALGLPGYSRIPTAMLQVLLDRLVLGRPLEEAIGDTRVHYMMPFQGEAGPTFEAERSMPAAVAEEMQRLGWTIALPENPGRGRYFGGINAVEIDAGGTLTGFADPRRTSVAVGY
jgi:gamma-glutamyltranspeptidase/glutathione hydrolase